MSDRLSYYFQQRVSESELNLGFQYLEAADRNLTLDQLVVGVTSGIGVLQAIVPNLTIICGQGTAYDKLGERIRVPSGQSLDVSQDFNAVSTAVSGAGNTKWLSVFLVFGRALSDPRVDGNSITVYFENLETFQFKVVQGAEGVGPSRPPLDVANILLCDIQRAFGVGTIHNADISTTRREDAVVTAGSPQSLRTGTLRAALSALLGFYNAHVTGVADRHPATQTDFSGGGTWADGSHLAASTVEAALDAIVSAAGANSGAGLLGSAAIAGATYSAAAGPISTKLSAIYAALNALALGTVLTTGAQNVTGTKTWQATQNIEGSVGAPSSANDQLAALTTTYVPASYKLLWVAQANTYKLRIYSSFATLDGTPGSALLFTVNAKWNGTNWVRDDTTGPKATILELNSQALNFNFYFGGAGVILVFFPTATYGFPIPNPGFTGACTVDPGGHWVSNGEVDPYYYTASFAGGGGQVAGACVNLPKFFPSDPSTATFSVVSGVNCAAPAIVANKKNGLAYSITSTGAGAFSSRGTVAIS